MSSSKLISEKFEAQAVILAGGFGTRLKSVLGSEIPKPMAPFAGIPLLEHQITLLRRHGFKRIMILVHHQADYIQTYFGDGTSFGIQIKYSIEKIPRGTAGAIYDCLSQLSDVFVVLYGDTYLDVDLTHFYETKKDDFAVVTFCHPNSHPFDSDLLELDSFGRVLSVFRPSKSGEDLYKNIVNAALYVADKRIFKSYVKGSGVMDISSELFPILLEHNEHIQAYKSVEFIKDMGTPKRYHDVQESVLGGATERLSRRNKRLCLFLDRDGVINKEDIIKIKFSEKLNDLILTGKSADKYFLFVTENDRFGLNDSSVVVSSNTVSYYGADLDSSLHVVLGDDAILANSSATSRILDIEGTGKTTLIRTENNPSIMIIDPNITMNMIQGEIGSDVGYPTNRDSLDNQIIQIASGQNTESIYSKFAVLVDDEEQPTIANFYPYVSDTMGVYPYTPVKGFITGRNLIYYSDLVSILSNYPAIDFNSSQLKSNTDYLPQLLKTIEGSVNINPLVDDLLDYKFDGLAGDLNDSLVIVNPLKQMFTSINEPLEFSFEDSGLFPEDFLNKNNMELAYDSEFDNSWNFNETSVNNNFEISKPGIKLINSQLWIKVNTILENQFTVNSYQITIDERERPRSDGENFIWSAPNPYKIGNNEPMVIEYEISNNINKVEVLIIDSGGTLVYIWEDYELSKNIGRNRISGGWSARNKSAFKVSSGMYLLVLKIDNEIKSSWMMVIR